MEEHWSLADLWIGNHMLDLEIDIQTEANNHAERQRSKK